MHRFAQVLGAFCLVALFPHEVLDCAGRCHVKLVCQGKLHRLDCHRSVVIAANLHAVGVLWLRENLVHLVTPQLFAVRARIARMMSFCCFTPSSAISINIHFTQWPPTPQSGDRREFHREVFTPLRAVTSSSAGVSVIRCNPQV